MLKYLIFITWVGLTCGQENLIETETIEDISCTTNDNLDGLYVPYYLCSDNNTVIEDGIGIIKPRFGAGCQKSLDVCCGLTTVVKDPIILSTVRPPPKRLTGCGIRNANGVNVKVSDSMPESSQFGEFPWMVAILRDKNPGIDETKLYICGGALIHWKVVLTVAHCVLDENKTTLEGLSARMGEWDTRITTEPIPYEDRKIINIDYHKNFNPSNYHNDIAFLTLESPVTHKPSIDLICLPNIEEQMNRKNCLVTGWGKDEFGEKGRYQVVLKKIELSMVNNAQCQRLLRRTRLGARYLLDRSFNCAGGEAGQDACEGDGGSPLVCPMPNQPDRYELVGLVAWGIGCGTAGVPGVYANVPVLREWINEQILFADIYDRK